MTIYRAIIIRTIFIKYARFLGMLMSIFQKIQFPVKKNSSAESKIVIIYVCQRDGLSFCDIKEISYFNN